MFDVLSLCRCDLHAFSMEPFLTSITTYPEIIMVVSTGTTDRTLFIVFLVFLNGFSTLWQYPVTLTSMVIVSIAGQPGLSVGACWSNGWLGMAGVGIGAGFYAILAKLGEHHSS